MTASDRYYIEYDVLMDTRLSMLMSLYPEETTDMLKDGTYTCRLSDDFTRVLGIKRQAIFKSQYANRGALHEMALSQAQYTLAAHKVNQLVTEAIRTNAFGGDVQTFSFTVNMYPYVLSDKAKEQVLESLKCVFQVKDVKLIYRETRNVTWEWIRGGFTDVFIYDADEFFKVNMMSIIDNPSPSLTIYMPTLVRDGQSATKEEVEKHAASLTFITSMSVCTVPRSSEYVSMYIPDL